MGITTFVNTGRYMCSTYTLYGTASYARAADSTHRGALVKGLLNLIIVLALITVVSLQNDVQDNKQTSLQ